MTLEQTLSQLREKFGKMVPAAPAAVMDGHIDFLRKSGVVYTFPADLKNLYLNVFKIDVQAVNDASVWQLPIPARFIIDTSGTIRDAKADPDYRYRPDPSEALAVAKSLGLRNP
jgi:peroxiredoxin